METVTKTRQNVSHKKVTGKFDWNNVVSIGITPQNVPLPTKEEIEKLKTVLDLYVGIPPQQYVISYYIDGIQVTSGGMNFAMKAINHSSSKIENKICLVLQYDLESWQFIELDDILDSKGLKIIEDLVTKQKQLLYTIANEYEKHNRQFYHFMYDLIGLVKAVSNLSDDEKTKLLNETRTAQELLHNRVHAELYTRYKLQGVNVELKPVKTSNTRNPDLSFNGIFSDVKSILITDSKTKEKLFKKFAKKLKEDIIEREKQKDQIGEKGTFFIAVWSGIISSVFYVMYNSMKKDKIFHDVTLYDDIPPFEENKAVFVLPSHNAFKNYYLVMNRDRAVRIAEYLAGKGYNKIKKSDAMSYLALTNIKKECSFGITGKNPSMIFNVT